MKLGHIYKPIQEEDDTCKCGAIIPGKFTRFPFDEEYGIYCGTSENGWLVFRFSGKREGIIAGGNYEEVKVDIVFED